MEAMSEGIEKRIILVPFATARIKEGGSENGPGGAHGGAELGRVGGKMRFSGQKSRS